MVSVMQSMARLAHLTFNNINKCQSEEVFNESLNKLTKLMSQLSHKDIKGIDLNKELTSEPPNRLSSLSLLRHLESKKAPVSHVSICETKHFQMCIFGLRCDTSRIPLHDHPDMYGLIKVVLGSVTISHYTALPTDSSYILPKEVSKQVSKWERNLLVPTVHNGNTIIDSKDQEVCVLTPSERNIHEVVNYGSDPAAILDILAPPYKEDRECHYYKVIATVFDKRLQRDITWLLEIDPPEDYWCDSLPYNGPQIKQVDLL